MASANSQRLKDNKAPFPTYDELLGGGGNDYDEIYIICLQVAGMDFDKADRYYKGMDIVELYDKQSYLLAMSYQS